jgi:hypothetical protein
MESVTIFHPTTGALLSSNLEMLLGPDVVTCEICEQIEFEAFRRLHEHDTPILPAYFWKIYLLTLFIADRTIEAKFLWDRMVNLHDDEFKESCQDVQILANYLGEENIGDAIQHAMKPEQADSQLGPYYEILITSLREKKLKEYEVIYKTIEMSQVCIDLAMNDTDVREICQKYNWKIETDDDSDVCYIYPQKRQNQNNNEITTHDNIHDDQISIDKIHNYVDNVMKLTKTTYIDKSSLEIKTRERDMDDRDLRRIMNYLK